MARAGRVLVVLALLFLASGAGWLVLRPDDVRLPPSASTVAEILDEPDEHLRNRVDVAGFVVEDDLLEEDVAGSTIIGTEDRPLLVIARDAQELPPLQDGTRIRVAGELQILEVAARDGLLTAGPVMERFADQPFVLAEQVEVISG